jgi:hypothetical protein
MITSVADDRWVTGEELRARSAVPPLGCFGWGALMMSRMALFFGSVVVPGSAAAGIVGDESLSVAQKWVIVPVVLAVVVWGFVHCVRGWRDPPAWAVLIAKADGYRDRWHRHG